MKALALILLGAIVFTGAGVKFVESRATDSSGSASLWFVGIIVGVVIGLIGLVMNHNDHTRRR